jgi:BON domain
MLKRELKWSVVVVTGLLLLGSSLLMARPQDSASTEDSAITTAIQAKLFQDPSLKTQDVQVSTQDGVVTLTGTVDSQEQRAAVDRIASMEQGVVKVIDSLSVNDTAANAPAEVENSAPESEPAPESTPAPESAPQAVPARPANQSQPFGNAGSQAQSVPPSLVLPAGTLVSVRVIQALSSDHNQAGDGFTATLAQPVVVSGWVVARRGQTVQGRVAVAKKGGRVKGTSELGINLTELTLVNGHQLPIQTRLLETSAGSSKGGDVAAVGTTTGLGAAIGAAAAGGEGAAIGAGAGAVASIAGVLLTRGRPTVIPPEALLTFRLESSANISTVADQAAFRQATEQDFAQNTLQRRPERYGMPPPPYYGAPLYWGYYGWPGYYPAYWGPGWGYWGPGFIGFYGYRGYRGGRFYHGRR